MSPTGAKEHTSQRGDWRQEAEPRSPGQKKLGWGAPCGAGPHRPDGHNQGSKGKQVGNFTSQPDLFRGSRVRCPLDQAQLHLCWKDSTAMLSWGRSQTHPSGPQGSGLQEERNEELRQASWPISEAAPACIPSLPQDQCHRQAVGSLEKDGGLGWGLLRVGSKGSQSSILLLGPLLVRALLVRGTEKLGDSWFSRGSQPAICCGSSPAAGQASASLNPVGTEGARGRC